MFKINKLIQGALVCALMLCSVPSVTHASQITRIRHPRASMTFTNKSVYYASPHFGRTPFPKSREQDQVWHMSYGNPGENKPIHVEPYLQTRTGRQLWYKFYKPSQDGDIPFRAWIPSYGLMKYPTKPYPYAYQIHHKVRAHKATRRNKLIKRRTRKPVSHRIDPAVAYNLYLARLANRRYSNDLKSARINKRLFYKYLNRALNDVPNSASEAQANRDYYAAGLLQYKFAGLE